MLYVHVYLMASVTQNVIHFTEQFAKKEAQLCRMLLPKAAS